MILILVGRRYAEEIEYQQVTTKEKRKMGGWLDGSRGYSLALPHGRFVGHQRHVSALMLAITVCFQVMEPVRHQAAKAVVKSSIE